jgi:hypothetical protein
VPAVGASSSTPPASGDSVDDSTMWEDDDGHLYTMADLDEAIALLATQRASSSSTKSKK